MIASIAAAMGGAAAFAPPSALPSTPAVRRSVCGGLQMGKGKGANIGELPRHQLGTSVCLSSPCSASHAWPVRGRSPTRRPSRRAGTRPSGRQHTDRWRACTRPGMRGELKKRAEMERMREQMFGDDSDGIPVFTVYVRSKKGQVWCTGSQGMRFDAACTRRHSRRVLARMHRGNGRVVRTACARDDSRQTLPFLTHMCRRMDEHIHADKIVQTHSRTSSHAHTGVVSWRLAEG